MDWLEILKKKRMKPGLVNKYLVQRVVRTLRPLQCCWRAIRQLSGDDGYERYLVHHAASHPHIPLLSRKAWFVQQQQQKWFGIKRCC